MGSRSFVVVYFNADAPFTLQPFTILPDTTFMQQLHAALPAAYTDQLQVCRSSGCRTYKPYSPACSSGASLRHRQILAVQQHPHPASQTARSKDAYSVLAVPHGAAAPAHIVWGPYMMCIPIMLTGLKAGKAIQPPLLLKLHCSGCAGHLCSAPNCNGQGLDWSSATQASRGVWPQAGALPFLVRPVSFCEPRRAAGHPGACSGQRCQAAFRAMTAACLLPWLL